MISRCTPRPSALEALFAALLIAACGGTDEPADVPLPASCDQELEPEDCEISDGDFVDITRIEDFDIICSSPCTRASHGVYVEGVAGLRDLSPLRRLRVIGTLLVSGNPDLETLEGLDALETVTELRLERNPKLKTLDGMPSLRTIRAGVVLDTMPIESIAALGTVETISEIGSASITVFFSPKLHDLHGLENIAFGPAAGINLSGANGLTDLSGLDNVTALPKGVAVFDCKNLTSLAGLEALQTVGGVNFQGNHMLSDCAIQDLVDRVEIPPGDPVVVLDNKPCP